MRIATLLALTLPFQLVAFAEESSPGSGAHAGSLNNIDIRVSLNGGNEGIHKRRNEALDSEIDYNGESSGGLSVHVLYLRARPAGVGFAVGGGISAFSHEGSPELIAGAESTLSAVAIDAYGAFVYRPTNSWHFELPAVVLSGGSATVETEGRTDSDTGSYSRLALQVGAYHTFRFGLQLGVDVGVAGFSATVDQEIVPNVKQEITYSGDGGFINLNIGFRF
jgi:hypothetical protein